MKSREYWPVEREEIKIENKNDDLRKIGSDLLGRILEDEYILFGIERDTLEKECHQLSSPFLTLLEQYAKLKSAQDYRAHLDDFLKKYNSFLDDFYYCMSGTGRDQQIYFVIAYFWLQTLKQLERSAEEVCDFLGRSIYAQLQTDITLIVHKIYKAN